MEKIISFKTKGFSLIELMIVIAIIGVLAAIAVPAYQNYVLRAKFSELLSYATGQRTAVSQYLTEKGTTSLAADSCASMPNKSGTPGTAIVASWAVDDACEITVTAQTGVFGGTAPVVTLNPTIAADGSLTWACTSGSAYAPSNCP